MPGKKNSLILFPTWILQLNSLLIHRKSVFNELEGKNVVLSKAELDIIKRIQERRCPDASYDPYPNTVEWFTSKTAIHPVTNRPEPKSRFIPSKWEAQKVCFGSETQISYFFNLLSFMK